MAFPGVKQATAPNPDSEGPVVHVKTTVFIEQATYDRILKICYTDKISLKGTVNRVLKLGFEAIDQQAKLATPPRPKRR